MYEETDKMTTTLQRNPSRCPEPVPAGEPSVESGHYHVVALANTIGEPPFPAVQRGYFEAVVLAVRRGPDPPVGDLPF